MNKKNFNRFLQVVLIIVLLILSLQIAVERYADNYYSAHATAYEQINHPGAGVSVVYTDDRIVFRPAEPVAGVIFYPGALVEYTAYAPLMESLAENGIFTIVLRMPYNMAILDGNRADGILEEYPEIEKWYMAGHSLGGACASVYAKEHADEFDGLILLASYPPKPMEMDKVRVLSIYGTNDGVLNQKKYQETIAQNTPGAQEVVINGGIHSYFGDYGPQQDDGTPEISYEEQMGIAVDEMVRFVNVD